MKLKKRLIVESQNGEQEGIFTGHEKSCRMEGCRGIRLRVVWPDGGITWPCTRGLEPITEERSRIM